MEALNQQIERELRAGKATAALEAAVKRMAGEPGRPPKDVAIEIARLAAGVYRDFVSKPVEEFAQAAPHALPGEPGDLISKALQRLFTINANWEKKIAEVHRERLARDLRRFVMGKRLREAEAQARGILAMGTDANDRERLAAFIGNVLGTVVNQPVEAQEVIRTLQRDAGGAGLTQGAVDAMHKTYNDRQRAMANIRMETLETEWSRILVQTETEIQNALPEKNKMGDPDEAVLRDVGDIFRSIVRVGLSRPDEYLVDTTLLLDDFTPRELSLAASQSGVQQRTYNALGFTAKKAVLLTFQEIGKSANFTEPYLKWAERALEGDYAKPIIEVMGAMRTEAFQPMLLKAYADRRFDSARPLIVEALGNIGSPQSISLLKDELAKAAKLATADSAKARETQNLLTALSRVSRSPRTTQQDRVGIAAHVMKSLPEENTRLSLPAAMSIMTYKAADLTPAERQWAVRVLVAGLWLTDESASFAKGGERQESHLGFRHEIAEALKVLAPLEADTFLAQANRNVLRFSGAYMAVAEVVEKAALTNALPLLEAMLMNALMSDDATATKYQKETYWDAASQQRVELSRDKIVSPIVYAIGKVCGQPGRAVLQQVQQQIQAGRMSMPGQETARFLAQFGGLPGGGTPMDPPTGASAVVQVQPTDPKEVKELLGALRSGYWFTGKEKRRVAKVRALTRLAQLTPPDALADVVNQLTDKDAMVASAAVTATASFAAVGKPRAVVDEVLEFLAGKLESRDPALRLGLIKVFKDIGPARSEVKGKLLAALKATTRDDTRRTIETILKNSPGSVKPDTPTGSVPAGSGDAQPKPPISGLDAKRAYLLARQAWIQSGKKGDPPQPPPGVSA